MTDSAASRLPPGLLEELHGFLSLEAPFLIRDLPRVSSEEELEAALLERIGARSRTGPEFGPKRLYPFVTHEQAVAWTREALVIQVRGFFERRRIKSSITAEERKLISEWSGWVVYCLRTPWPHRYGRFHGSAA